MIVECISNPYPENAELEVLLKVKPQVVFGIYFETEKTKISLIDPEDNEPMVCDFACFNIVDSKIPEEWVISRVHEVNYSIKPIEFQCPGFWDNFYDYDEEAREIFDDVMRKIHLFHGLAYPEKKVKAPSKPTAQQLLKKYGIEVD